MSLSENIFDGTMTIPQNLGCHRETDARAKDSILVEELKMLNRGFHIGRKDGQESAC